MRCFAYGSSIDPDGIRQREINLSKGNAQSSYVHNTLSEMPKPAKLKIGRNENYA